MLKDLGLVKWRRLSIREGEMRYTWGPMPHPFLLFCPYLTLSPDKSPLAFADWELGPLESFNNQWADPRFKEQATAFLSKFAEPSNERIDNSALLCRKV